MRRGLDGFLLAMIGTVVLAFLFPDPGAQGGWMHPELLNKLGVALIFLLNGVALPFDALKRGTLRWQLHLIVQLATFGLFPLLGLVLIHATGDLFAPDLRTGLFYLCALPSTVSSSVALTATARGDVPSAVFNATLSSLLGVFITPFWLGIAFGSTGQALPLGKVILDLALWLLLPLAIGQLLRPWFGAFAARHKSRISLIDRGTILLLVYTSFCDSVKAGLWSSHGLRPLYLTAIACVLLLAAVMSVVALATRGFALPQRIAAIFCGSKKTLASGVPMARLLFGAHPGLGMILLPIMLFHPLQLVVCGYMAGRWARRTSDEPAREVVPVRAS